VEEIEAHAKGLGLAVRKISLDAQFRCGGSEAYVEWVRRLLGLAPGGPLPWAGDPAFSVQVADTPQEMEHLLQAQADAGTAPGWRPDSAGRGVTPARTDRWCPTS
jgi:hypothetical protein